MDFKYKYGRAATRRYAGGAGTCGESVGKPLTTGVRKVERVVRGWGSRLYPGLPDLGRVKKALQHRRLGNRWGGDITSAPEEGDDGGDERGWGKGGGDWKTMGG